MNPIPPLNPADRARQNQLFAQLASLPPDVRAFVAQQYAETQIAVLPLPYWSTIRFQATIAANVATIDTSERKAFAYGIGNSMQIAGFDSTFRTATLADTNLLTQSQTRDNADVWIWGIAAQITPDSEPVLAGRVWRNSSVQISLNGTQQIPLGTLEMFPGAGGLYGTGTTYLKAPATNIAGAASAGEGAKWGFVQNGNPMAGNFLRLPQPFKWSAVGTGGADSSLNITVKPEATITESVSAARAAVAVVAMVTPGTIEPYAQPAALAQGTYVDVRFHLICVAVARRSANT